MPTIKIMIAYLFVLITAISFAQEKKTNSTQKSRSAYRPFYRTKTSDLFYIGVENSFILYKNPSKKYQVSIKNGIMIQKDTLSPEKQSKDSSVYYISTKNTEPTIITVLENGKSFIYKFRNRQIPSPSLFVSLGNGERIKGGNVKANDFSKAENVILTLNDFDYDCSFYIVNMEITKVSNGENKNYILTDNKIGEVAKWCAPAEIYILHNVVIEFSRTKDQRSINGTTFFIK